MTIEEKIKKIKKSRLSKLDRYYHDNLSELMVGLKNNGKSYMDLCYNIKVFNNTRTVLLIIADTIYINREFCQLLSSNFNITNVVIVDSIKSFIINYYGLEFKFRVASDSLKWSTNPYAYNLISMNEYKKRIDVFFAK